MPKETAFEESFTQDIHKLLESFSEKDTVGKQALSQLQMSEPHAFAVAATRALTTTQPTAGARYLVYLLTKEKMLPASLLDAKITHEAAVTALRTVAATGTNLQPMLELALNKALQDQPNTETSDRILRLLDLLAAVAAPTVWNSFQLELMAYPDKVVRSKATLTIGRSTRNAAWIGRRFMDRDPRVQASAVEALWYLDAADSKSLLLTASKSRYNRAAANAALGLYRIGEPKAVGLLMELGNHPDPLFRLSGLWAIGETQDPRFLPFLTEQFKNSSGKIHLAVTRALARIRRREKEMAETTHRLSIRVMSAMVGQDGQRSLNVTLSSQPSSNLGGLKRTDFALWEGGALVQDYSVASCGNPALVVAGFVAPRSGVADPYNIAVMAALNRCLGSKRADDLWRIDRYTSDSAKPETPVEQSPMPYQEAFMTVDVKAKFGCIAAPDLLSKVISSEVPRECTASDAYQAVARQCEALAKVSGARHIFVFLNGDAAAALSEEARLRTLTELLSKAITPHFITSSDSGQVSALRELSRSMTGGTFTETALEKLPEALEEICSHGINGYEITYRGNAVAEAGPVTLKVSSHLGSGQAEITLASQPAA